MTVKTYNHLMNLIDKVKKDLSDDCFFEDKDYLHRGANYQIADIRDNIMGKLVPMLDKKRPKTIKEQEKVVRDYLISMATLDYVSNVKIIIE